MEEKITPQDLEAEQSILGAMMLSRDAIALVAGTVKPDYFYREAHAHIFRSIIELYQKNEPVDLVTVSSQLKKIDKLEESGGRRYLAEVLDSVPSAASVEKYGQIVTDKAVLRKLIDAGGKIIDRSYDHSGEVDFVLESAQKTILDICKERVREDFVKLDQVLKVVFDNIQNKEQILGVSSGFADLDALTSGFNKGDLIILAARPAMGKTTLALNFATNAAVHKKQAVAIFSLEMPKDQLALRLLSSEAKLDSKRLRTENLHDHEYRTLMHALGNLSEAPIYIDDSPAISPMELRAKTRRLQAEADIKLIVVDYLQLMRSAKRQVESRFQEVSEIVRELKAFAKEAGIPIIALSQLSRDVERRQDKRPQLSDLRESGEIEQTADLVLMLHRDDYYDPAAQNAGHHTSATELIISKHRNGPTGTVKVVFRKDISKFMSAETRVAVPQ